MSNQSEIDYEKQFNEDLAKATALSLEQQALDEYNRTKKYGHAGSSSSYYDNVRKNHSSTVNKTTATAAPKESNLDNDLINFNSPTSQKPNEQQTFETLINDLQQFQTSNYTQTALVPMSTPPTNAVAIPNFMPPQAAAAAAAAAAASNMQLEVFTAPQKMPLTNENLQQLYNMPYVQRYGVPARPSPPTYSMGFVSPAAVNAAYMPPHAGHYAYQYYGNSYAAITPPIATANGAAPTFPAPVQAKIVGGSITDGRSLNRQSSVASGENNLVRRASRSATGDDLIDLNQLDDSRVSVLEAFDPLLNEGETELKHK